ncbi:hypothetical protein B0O99DRAFT_632136 [Bisporella sp. PMI_857]|nr:hypothetical protein B0O99DRAFT_632136 [Bisporella sp. PMI_857]
MHDEEVKVRVWNPKCDEANALPCLESVTSKPGESVLNLLVLVYFHLTRLVMRRHVDLCQRFSICHNIMVVQGHF